MANLFSNARDRQFASAISKLAYANPFLPARIRYEEEALGDAFSDSGTVWSARPGELDERPNVALLQTRAEQLATDTRVRASRMPAIAPADWNLYADLILYVLYYRSWRRFDELLADPLKSKRVATYKAFSAEFRHYLELPSAPPPVIVPGAEAHVFALFYQIRRAFRAIFGHIVGTSMPVAQLRAAVWQSIFTCDLAAYRAALFDRLHDVPTLITGASGTGKELVARAIALSGYLPFDAKSETFAPPFGKLFVPLNLSALSPTLVESELFGHRRGAFTGALEDRVGWLEHCPAGGSVFLDEIGELDGQIQVKLLRVLQTRTFQRLGENEPRVFAGKIIAATNRNLGDEMKQRRFRTDLYYRLCADMITTPPLAEQLRGAADPVAELRLLLRFIARRVAGPELAEDLADRVADYIERHVGRDYAWPGNFRELEQCVRNILIRGAYHPPPAGDAPADAPSDASRALAEAIRKGSLTADDLLDQYVAIVYGVEKTFESTARVLNLDRRTVRARLARLRLL